jgi:hypothetical protein
VVPAVKVVVILLAGLIEPSLVLVRTQAYVTFPGQVELHDGVAVKVSLLPEGTEGDFGATDTEFRVTGAVVMVMMVEAPLVVPPSEAFT